MFCVSTLQILHNVDPTGEIPDPPELGPLEGMAKYDINAYF